MKKKDFHSKESPMIPKTPQAGVASDINEYYPGDSVNEHSHLEVANELIGRGEIEQQNNNL
ncbi:hypothetical protein J2S13_002021 [Oikeobacillus pervagus]|uniref:DUF4025 domain-containing protein n=1 Tax=Oikeobacillus pervagus TaxID=1325931 RepID=A0AAJ1SZA0_9BACI|nr:hypothetical protein [Oikeobacillus pervagus]MDQ0215603.1 hypothetical protein [Oikeobacillus pervagus]